MAKLKRAAIRPDDISKRKMSEISATDFLKALNDPNVGIQIGHLSHIWPEKKKVEYWGEPENLSGIRVGDLIHYLRGEKKKFELEKPPGGENWVIDREILYKDLYTRLSRDLAKAGKPRR